MAIKRRYLHFIERDSEKVSIKWKVLHVFLFILIAINAICSAYAFNHMFNAFNQRCVFYVNPVFSLQNIQYHTIEYENITNVTSTESEMNGVPKRLDEEYIPGLNFKDPEVPDVEVRNGRYWVNNETLTAQVIVDLRKTLFADVVLCDWVLFVPLITFIIAVFLGVLVMILERGGKGYTSDILRTPWALVYPCAVVCAVMILFYLYVSTTVKEGLTTFCSHFEPYTGKKTCSKRMDYFTIQRRFGKKHFYLMCVICLYSYPFGMILWIFQLALNVLRVVSAADFQLTSILVESKNSTDELTEDAVHQALIKTYPELATAVVVSDDNQPEELKKRDGRRKSIMPTTQTTTQL